MKRIVCIVEGHGECEAAPVLCHRVLRTLLDVGEWYVDEDPIRQSRGLMVDQRVPSPRRPPAQTLHRPLQLAMTRVPDGILVLCDADDDCPATWGPAVPAFVERAERSVPVRGVMASREYESWLLWAHPHALRAKVKATNPESAPRDAKKALDRILGGYAPSTHQLAQTRACDLHAIWAASDSSDKFVRSLADLVGVAAPTRPSL